MKKIFDFKGQISTLSTVNEVYLGSLKSGLYDACNQFANKKIELIITEKDFKKFGLLITSELKNLSVETKIVTLEDRWALLKDSFDFKVSAVLVVGDNELLSTVRYYSALSKVPCFAVSTSPVLEGLFNESFHLTVDGEYKVVTAEKFKKVIIDSDLILKSRSENFAEAYALTLSKLTTLIDYKMSCFLSGTKVDESLFSGVKRAVNFALSFPLYENGKLLILLSQVILVGLPRASEFDGFGAESLRRALSVYASEVKKCKRAMTSFEKTLKLYHMFFTNDFSTLLSSPDYILDIETIKLDFNISEEVLYSGLKIPSEKRRKLIVLLLEKTAEDFSKETAIILKAFSKIKKAYSSLVAVAGDGNISYKQIKKSVMASTYLTDKTSVLTLMRDLGVLACAN